MASREDILPGDDEVKEKVTVKETSWDTIGFGILGFVFMILSIGIGWSQGKRDAVSWMHYYSIFWVFFTLLYLAIRDGSVNR